MLLTMPGQTVTATFVIVSYIQVAMAVQTLWSTDETAPTAYNV